MSDKSLNKLEVLDYYCKLYYLPQKTAIALSFGINPEEIDKFMSKLKVLDPRIFIDKKTLLDKYIVSERKV